MHYKRLFGSRKKMRTLRRLETRMWLFRGIWFWLYSSMNIFHTHSCFQPHIVSLLCEGWWPIPDRIPTVQRAGWEPALTLTGIIDETDRGGQSTVGMGSSTPPHVQQTNWEAFHRAQRSFRCSQYLYWTRWERGKAQKLEYLVVSWYEDYGIILAFTIVE